MTKLYGIQYLRALAAIAVVIFHAAERTGGHFAIGAAGVDIFFVISGFIMWVIAENRPISPGRFLLDRLKRIAPIYWIATLVMVGGAMAGLFPNLKLTLGHIFGSLFFIPHRSPSSGELWPVLVQGWTLNYEMFFYAVFAAVLFLPSRLRFGALALVFIGLVTCGALFNPQQSVLAAFTRPIMLEFLAGAALGKLWIAGMMPSARTGLLLIAASFAGFAFIGLTYMGWNPYIFCLLATALVLGVLALEKAAIVPKLAPLAYLGDGSYSIYIWHTMVISVVAKIGSAIALPGWSIIVLSTIGGTIGGLVAYEMLEKPLTRLLKKKPSPHREGLVKATA